MKRIFLAIAFVIGMSFSAFAATTPAIRLQMPAEVKAGETFTVQIVVDAAAQEKISAVTAALRWDTQLLEACGKPVLKNSELSMQLGAETNAAKGILEVAAASALDSAGGAGGKFVFAEQQFKVREGVKSGTVGKISFTTDKHISCGTECALSGKVTQFAIITGANFKVK